jgi:hypothetical protein
LAKITFTGGQQSDSICLTYHIVSALPEPSNDVPLADLLMFKHRRRDELLAFRTEIREFERDLAKASGPEEFKEVNASFSENLERSLLDLRSALRDSRIESGMASVKGLLALRPDSPLAIGMVSKIAGFSTHATLTSIGAAATPCTAARF